MTGCHLDRRLSPSKRDGQSARVARGTIAYAAAAVLQRAVLVLLLPFFARVLTPGQFGQVGVLTTLSSAIAVLAGLGLETAIFRGYLSRTDDERAAATFVNTVGLLAFVGALLLTTIAIASAPAVAPALRVPVLAYQLTCVGAGALAVATVVPMALLRAQERLGAYLRLTGMQAAITPLLTILFVAVLDLGPTGWMLAYAISSVALLVRGLALLDHRWALQLESAELAGVLAFSLPLIPHALSHWGLSVSDRAILGASVPSDQVGAYYIAYLFCLPISLIAISVSQATQPVYAEASSTADGVLGLKSLVSMQTLATISAAAAVGVIGPSLCLAILPPSYADAAPLIPWLALGTCLFGLYLVPIAAVNLVVGRTEFVWIITVVAASANIALNLVFVPLWGTAAAAVNTTIGYGALFAGVFLYMRRVCDPPLPYDLRRIILGSLIVVIPACTVAVVTDPASTAALAIRITVLIGSLMLLTGAVLGGEARTALRAIRSSKPHALP